MTGRVETSNRQRDAWTAIWGDALASVLPGSPLYPVVQDWWTRELGACGQASAVLEIGAGAGAHPARIAAGLFPSGLVAACDFRAAPARIPGVAYVGGATMEALPFADGAFDLILSQFAFEYARPEPASVELARLLRPGGVVRLLMHHPEAVFSTYLDHRIACLSVGAEIAQAAAARGVDRTLAKVRLKGALKRAEAMAARYAGAAAYPKVASDLAEFIKAGRRRLSDISGPDPEGDLPFLAQCEPALLIARAQEAATNDPAAMETVMQRFIQHGFDQADYAPLLVQDGDSVVAWAVRLRKRA